MKALRWHGKHKISVDEVEEPKILNPHDAIIKVTLSGICGSDLHIYNGVVKHMKDGDILGHETMGIVVEVGQEVTKLKPGDRVVIPFPISCGRCFFCQKNLFALCDNTNPNAELAKKEMGASPAGLFSYSHLLGGYPGGQAEFIRVPYADVGPIKIPDNLSDEKVLFLSDIFPTGYMAAENAQIEKGDTVAIWGCGPVGQFSIKSAWMLGAGRVIAIDCVPERLALAQSQGNAETINFLDAKVQERLQELTNGRGPDRCIDAVGTEAHTTGSLDAIWDKVKQMTHLGTDRPHVLREAIMCCRKGGTVSVPGVYFGFLDHIPMGAAINKGLTLKMGQTHVQNYLAKLLDKIINQEIDPSYIISHRISLEEAPDLYKKFADKNDNCIKVVIKF